MRQRNMLDARVKTISLPSGELKLRASRAKVVVDDEAALLTWCEEHNCVERFFRITPMLQPLAQLDSTPYVEDKQAGVSRARLGSFTTQTEDAEPRFQAVDGVCMERSTEKRFGYKTAQLADVRELRTTQPKEDNEDDDD